MHIRVKLAILVAVLGAAGVAGGVAMAGPNSTKFLAALTGYEEVPLPISTTGGAAFNATANSAGTAITYNLAYSALEGNVTQAHIHFGQTGIAGGISAFLCSNLGNGPMGTQACPPGPAVITGTITATDVIGPAAQGIAPGEFAELLKAIRAGVTYANIHSNLYPSGEVRGQLKSAN